MLTVSITHKMTLKSDAQQQQQQQQLAEHKHIKTESLMNTKTGALT